MKQLTGTVDAPGKAPSVVPPTPVTDPLLKNQPTLVNLLPSIQKADGSSLVDHGQALNLVSLRFKKSGQPVLDINDRYFTYEIVNMLNQADYEIVYNFLSAGWEDVFDTPGLPINKLRRKMLFENPLMQPAKERLALDMEIFRNRVDVSKGAVDCKKCGSDETIAVEKQVRSADEPMTIRVTCLQCQYKWTAQ